MIVTEHVWKSNSNPPKYDGYYIIYDVNNPVPVMVLHYDVFLRRWTVDEELMNREAEFFWTFMPSELIFSLQD